ncbi:DNA-binding MarR family transcriptional regulator [Mariniflexile fucanivorans]|uniref:DNA-binding MarR family transcriptional regulator n=1 Tax=Mariniflexile fucanivorans TaxID=264023 RepID=A0A4V2QED0_9FLAO|nr:MarR family transcriptional regulator [Mariniflexile fucanivorans]TCL67567.1 DNA-binding MarR family transcriptional regulator [Mariniflexile fucanivorans]
MGDISKDINSTFPNNKIKALLNILYTANWISSYQNEFFKIYGISPQQYNILRILKGAGQSINVQDIKDRMIERAPNATRLMDKLCAKNYIDRLPSEFDRRVVKIAITKEGKALLDAIPDSLNNDLLKNLNEAEAEQLSNLLDKMR